MGSETNVRRGPLQEESEFMRANMINNQEQRCVQPANEISSGSALVPLELVRTVCQNLITFVARHCHYVEEGERN